MKVVPSDMGQQDSLRNAPIALFAYNRPWHLRQTVEALQNNTLAKDSDLFIFSDGAKDSSASPQVTEVRDYIHSIRGFKSIKVIERNRNYGLSGNIIDAVTNIVNEHERIIVLEDDLVTSPYFLSYMNDALNYYDKCDEVISVHGYIYPVPGTLPETFFLKGADCWGWATWKRGWDIFESDGRLLLSRLLESGLSREFDYGGAYGYTNMLKRQVNGKNDSWAVRWYASAFLEDKLTLYPGRSLVANIGNDSSGTHCGVTDVFGCELADEPVRVTKISVEENVPAKKKFAEFLKSTKTPLNRRLVNLVRNMLHNS